jgi:hypothetical protein
MKVSRETQRMLLDAGALFDAPGGGVRRHAVGEKAVDRAVDEIAQIVAVACDRNDLLLVGRIGNEGVDARIGIRIAGDHPEPKFFLRERVEHLLDGPEWVAAAGALGQDQHVGLGSVRFRDIRESLALRARSCARRDVGTAVGERRQMLVPGHLRQRNLDPQDARQRPLDLHVEACEDRHPVPVLAVLIPLIPAAAKMVAAGGGRGRARMRRFRSRCGGDARRHKRCEDKPQQQNVSSAARYAESRQSSWQPGRHNPHSADDWGSKCQRAAACPQIVRRASGARRYSGPRARFRRHCEKPTGPARSGRPDDKLRDEAIQDPRGNWIVSLALAMMKRFHSR